MPENNNQNFKAEPGKIAKNLLHKVPLYLRTTESYSSFQNVMYIYLLLRGILIIYHV